MMETKVLKIVGQRVRDLRKQMGLSQEELGEKDGLHFSYIGGIERAEKNITLINLQKIAEVHGVSIHDLFAYSKLTIYRNNDIDVLLNSIHEKLASMKKSDLKKVQLFLNELFE
ncbi:helix-turn-helix transcriptional regulator [Paenibacillus sp. LHD-38]|uniref:helix-turn-helix domain-containing protein n=1 Tax=Paenibacillus sp. LHD-38 TaxID=3072143 RepID=UPI00280CF876|nr:helix-turn-helix transcriptional regulator [Paenibacillus sp. LHD-38]MDQ8739115.1 helix-turn-helix transcriptional regulator [Paenibacillus sp. LHD-38]